MTRPPIERLGLLVTVFRSGTYVEAGVRFPALARRAEKRSGKALGAHRKRVELLAVRAWLSDE